MSYSDIACDPPCGQQAINVSVPRGIKVECSSQVQPCCKVCHHCFLCVNEVDGECVNPFSTQLLCSNQIIYHL